MDKILLAFTRENLSELLSLAEEHNLSFLKLIMTHLENYSYISSDFELWDLFLQFYLPDLFQKCRLAESSLAYFLYYSIDILTTLFHYSDLPTYLPFKIFIQEMKNVNCSPFYFQQVTQGQICVNIENGWNGPMLKLIAQLCADHNYIELYFQFLKDPDRTFQVNQHHEIILSLCEFFIPDYKGYILNFTYPFLLVQNKDFVYKVITKFSVDTDFEKDAFGIYLDILIEQAFKGHFKDSFHQIEEISLLSPFPSTISDLISYSLPFLFVFYQQEYLEQLKNIVKNFTSQRINLTQVILNLVESHSSLLPCTLR